MPPALRPSVRAGGPFNRLSDMEYAKRNNRRKRPGGDAPELKVVAIHCNPAPDAQDRLRRLFTLLLEHTAGDRDDAPSDDPSHDDDGEEG